MSLSDWDEKLVNYDLGKLSANAFEKG